MNIVIVLKSVIIGLLMGFVFELLFRSINARKIIWPKFIDCQIYGTTGIFLAILYFVNITEFIKVILMFIIPTGIEFTTGYLYLKYKGVYLWDYKNEKLNFIGLICLKFSIIWFVIALFGYYVILPMVI